MNLIDEFLNWMKNLRTPSAASSLRGIDSLQVYTPRVLVINFDPVVDENGTRLVEKMGWNSVDLLIQEFINEMAQVSHGLVQYQYSSANRLDVDAIPVKIDGFQYTIPNYLAALRAEPTHHQPDTVDYQRIITDFLLKERVNQREIDEVWLFGGPYFGYWESHMVGRDAIWCNSAPLTGLPGCERRFVIMGFNYQRGVTEMLHNIGHRAESTMAHVFNSFDRLFSAYSAVNPALQPPVRLEKFHYPANDFENLMLYEKIAPGRAGLGLIHTPPNAQTDYDWNNPAAVSSSCDDWMSYPDLAGRRRMIDCAEWGCNERGFIRWWLSRLPHTTGRRAGVSNNWWRYIMQVDQPFK